MSSFASISDALDAMIPPFEPGGDWQNIVLRAGDAERGDRVRRTPAAPRRSWWRRPRRVIALALALVLIALLATPAFGVQGYLLQLLGRKNVSFVKSPPAPNVVKKFFFDLPIGVPPPSTLGVKAGQARQVATFSIGGHPRRLWVAPTTQGGYCFMFEHDFGSCRVPSRTSGVPLAVSWQGGPTRLGVNESIVTRVGGDLTPPTATRITAHYADGTSADIPFVWVSPPIAAGFFTYDIPAAHWSPPHRLLAITLSAKDGTQLARQSFPYRAHPAPVRHPVLPRHRVSPGPRALPTTPVAPPSAPTQTGEADGYRVLVGRNGAVQFTRTGQTSILTALAGHKVNYDCFRLTREFGIFTVRQLGFEGALAAKVGLTMNGVGAPIDGCDVEAPVGRTWPDRLHNRAAVQIPLTTAGRSFFADRAAARDLALFVRSRHMHQLRKEPAASARAAIEAAYGRLLARSPIRITVPDPATLRFSERSSTGKQFQVTVRNGRITSQNLKPYGLVF